MEPIIIRFIAQGSELIEGQIHSEMNYKFCEIAKMLPIILQ